MSPGRSKWTREDTRNGAVNLMDSCNDHSWFYTNKQWHIHGKNGGRKENKKEIDHGMMTFVGAVARQIMLYSQNDTPQNRLHFSCFCPLYPPPPHFPPATESWIRHCYQNQQRYKKWQKKSDDTNDNWNHYYRMKIYNACIIRTASRLRQILSDDGAIVTWP